MAGVPPRPEQTTLQIVVQGVQKEVKALHNPDGSFMTDANGYVYEASGKSGCMHCQKTWLAARSRSRSANSLVALLMLCRYF